MNLPRNIVGWVLIIAGIVLIFWTLSSTYKVFTGKGNIPEIFHVSPTSQEKTAVSQTQDLQTQMQGIIQDQLKGMIPSDTLPKILNLSVWSILAFIFLSAGSHIAGIGIKLLNKSE
jgi:hypothetical protein